MSIDIHRTKTGNSIKFAHPTAGYQHDQDQAGEHLVVGEIYKVSRIDVHDWNTNIWLEGFPEVIFNSVMFDNVEWVNHNPL